MVGGRPSLVDTLVDRLLDRIVSGEIGEGQALPPEAELARDAGVSRLTVREAVKILGAQRIVEIRRGLGTYVLPMTEWRGMDATLRVVTRGEQSVQAPLLLLEVRGIVETGAAALAASRHNAADLAAMASTFVAMEEADSDDGVDAFADADLAFHDAVLAAARNPFIPVTLGPLAELLHATRRRTCQEAVVRQRVLHHHRAIHEAIASGDPEAAVDRMAGHLAQVREDYETYVLPGSAAAAEEDV